MADWPTFMAWDPPLLTVATYLDDQTGFEIYQEVRLAAWWLGFVLL